MIGAGIVGLSVARELSLRDPDLRVAVLEREPRIAAHQTGHSSGVIHVGHLLRAGLAEGAPLRRRGAGAVRLLRRARDRRAARTGKLIVATGAEQLPRLAELERRGHANGVPGLRRLNQSEAREFEPHAACLAALHSPSTGVVDFAAVAGSFAADLERAGGTVHLGCAVESLGDGTLVHAQGTTRARATISCAGAWSDRLAVAAGAPPEPRIVPFRGAYLRLRPERSDLVRASIYPVPDPELPFLGAHLTRDADGSVLLGPTALLAGARDAYRPTRIVAADLRETLAWPGTWRLIRRHWRAGLTELTHLVSKRALVGAARRLVPELRVDDFVAGPAGVRGQALGRDGSLLDDFLVSRAGGVLFVRNAPSPAATSSLPLGRLVADEAAPLLA